MKIDATVKKAMKCSDTKYGFAEYVCVECYETFTCKSKFCNKCGRLYTLKWEEKQQGNMLRVAHRHSVFIIPDILRNYLYSRRDLLNELQDGVYDVINYWYSK